MENTHFFTESFEETDLISDAKYLYLPDALSAENLRRSCEIYDTEKSFLDKSYGVFYWDADDCEWKNTNYEMNFLANVERNVYKARDLLKKP